MGLNLTNNMTLVGACELTVDDQDVPTMIYNSGIFAPSLTVNGNGDFTLDLDPEFLLRPDDEIEISFYGTVAQTCNVAAVTTTTLQLLAVAADGTPLTGVAYNVGLVIYRQLRA